MSDEDEITDREHPVAETLSAYLANELSLAEDDALQEHVATCSLCAERLLDLQWFLEFVPERSREGVADLETAAQWRKLRGRVEREVEKRRFFASVRGGYSVAAVLMAVSLSLAVWNLNLVRESRQPRALATVQTLEARESLRGGGMPGLEESVSLPAQISLSLPTETPDPRYLVELIRQGSSHAEETLELSPQGSELRFFLPDKALPPGNYTFRVYGLRYGRPNPGAWTFELAIGSSGP